MIMRLLKSRTGLLGGRAGSEECGKSPRCGGFADSSRKLENGSRHEWV